MKKLVLLFIVILVTSNTNAQIVRSFSNEFLNIGIGARAAGLSKAVSSFTTGVEAGYWNPAGVITVQDYEFAAMHNSLFNGIGSYDYFGAALPIERNELALAVSVIRLGVDNILNTTNLVDNNGNINFNNVTSFSSADIAAILSIAKSFPKLHLNLGANAKIIRRNIGDFALGHGFGFDIGAQYEYKGVKLGLVIRDVTTTFTAWSVDDDIFDAIANAPFLDENGNVIPDDSTDRNQQRPEKQELTLPKFQLGSSYFKQFNEKYSLLTSVDILGRFIETNDLVSTSFVSFSPSLGLELGYKSRAFLRAGVGNIQQETDFDNTESITLEPNIGIGIKFRKVYIDYALTNVGASSGINYSNVFSIKVQLNEIR